MLHGEKKSETYNYITTSQIEQMAASLGVEKTVLRDDYMQDDITALFLKEPL